MRRLFVVAAALSLSLWTAVGQAEDPGSTGIETPGLATPPGRCAASPPAQADPDPIRPPPAEEQGICPPTPIGGDLTPTATPHGDRPPTSTPTPFPPTQTATPVPPTPTETPFPPTPTPTFSGR